MDETNPFASPLHLGTAMPVQAIPVAQPEGGIWRDNGVLVMRKTAVLPNICVKSNTPCEGQRLKRDMYWHHPAIFLTILLSIWIYIILALVLRKKATVWIPLSEEWWARRRQAITIGWSLVLLGALIAILCPIVGTANKIDLLLLGIPLGVVIGLGGAIYGLMAARMVAAKKVDDEFVWIKGIHPAYVASLPDFAPWQSDPRLR
jgi:hypothetical protein